MNLEIPFLLTFLAVFVRCSAMFLAAPIFGAAGVPVMVRVMSCVAISAALVPVIPVPAVPATLLDLGGLVLREALAGLLLGFLAQLVLQVGVISGSIMDMQMGLSMSQTMNPLSGVQVTVQAQMKQMLSVLIFFAIGGHRLLILAVVNSYEVLPRDWKQFSNDLIPFVSSILVLGLQVAGPVLAVALIVDAALGLMTRAVPQMQALSVGVPAKVVLGLMLVGATLPALVAAIESATERAFGFLR